MQTCHIFKKSDGAIRPVGIREALRRIMVKAVSWVFKKDIVESLSGYTPDVCRYGVWHRGGYTRCEKRMRLTW